MLPVSHWPDAPSAVVPHAARRQSWASMITANPKLTRPAGPKLLTLSRKNLQRSAGTRLASENDHRGTEVMFERHLRQENLRSFGHSTGNLGAPLLHKRWTFLRNRVSGTSGNFGAQNFSSISRSSSSWNYMQAEDVTLWLECRASLAQPYGTYGNRSTDDRVSSSGRWSSSRFPGPSPLAPRLRRTAAPLA